MQNVNNNELIFLVKGKLSDFGDKVNYSCYREKNDGRSKNEVWYLIECVIPEKANVPFFFS